mgnify:CR=1 FL=1
MQFCQRGRAGLAACRAFSLSRTSFSLMTRLNCDLRTAVQQALARSISADGGLPNRFLFLRAHLGGTSAIILNRSAIVEVNYAVHFLGFLSFRMWSVAKAVG